MKKTFLVAAIISAAFLAVPTYAFDLAFEWGNIRLCTSGSPNRVDNPTFTVNGVPQGTAQLQFQLVDVDVPQFQHGGGKVAYTGQKTIGPGAFKYLSPCPPNGSHTYRWTAKALDAQGKTLDIAKSSKSYP